jgi:hypothetical protein
VLLDVFCSQNNNWLFPVVLVESLTSIAYSFPIEIVSVTFKVTPVVPFEEIGAVKLVILLKGLGL